MTELAFQREEERGDESEGEEEIKRSKEESKENKYWARGINGV